MDRALPLPDLARLSAPAKPRDAVRARAAPACDRFSSRARPDPRPPHAGAAVRFGPLEGRYPRPRRQRGLAGGRDGGREQYLILPVRRDRVALLAVGRPGRPAGLRVAPGIAPRVAAHDRAAP